MIWLFLLFLLGAAAIIMLLPLDSSHEAPTDQLAFYRQQLLALEESNDDDYTDTKLELERRLLAANRRVKNSAAISKNDGSSGKGIQYSATGVTLLGAMMIYWQLGAPDVPAAPAEVGNILLDRPITKDGPTMAEAIAQVRARLVDAPDDVMGLQVLASSTRAVGWAGETAQIYGRLVKLQPDDVDWRIKKFEALVEMHHGTIVPASLLVLDGILALEPNHPAGQYYRGLSFRQAGNNDRALQIWTALMERTAEAAPWRPSLQAAIESVSPEENSAFNETAASVAAMDADSQAAFIAGMTARLEARLAANPDDVDGWLMLARTKFKMGDIEGAKAVLVEAHDLVNTSDRVKIASALDKLAQNSEF